MITLVVFVVGLLIGTPIIFLLVLGGLVFMAENDILILLDSLPVQVVRGITANGFLAIPLYMLVGELDAPRRYHRPAASSCRPGWWAGCDTGWRWSTSSPTSSRPRFRAQPPPRSR